MAERKTQKTKSAVNASSDFDSTDSEKSQSSTVPFGDADTVSKTPAQFNPMDALRFYIDTLNTQLATYIDEVTKLREDYKTCISDGSELKGKMNAIEGYAKLIIASLIGAVIGVIIFYYGVVNKQFTELKEGLSITREEFIKQQLPANQNNESAKNRSIESQSQ